MFAYILIGLYGLIASICLGFTLVEGAMSRERGWDPMRIAGILLSLFWPAVIVVVFFATPRGKRFMAGLRNTGHGTQPRPVTLSK